MDSVSHLTQAMISSEDAFESAVAEYNAAFAARVHIFHRLDMLRDNQRRKLAMLGSQLYINNIDNRDIPISSLQNPLIEALESEFEEATVKVGALHARLQILFAERNAARAAKEAAETAEITLELGSEFVVIPKSSCINTPNNINLTSLPVSIWGGVTSFVFQRLPTLF
jgi:hypothetical protein